MSCMCVCCCWPRLSLLPRLLLPTYFCLFVRSCSLAKEGAKKKKKTQQLNTPPTYCTTTPPHTHAHTRTAADLILNSVVAPAPYFAIYTVGAIEKQNFKFADSFCVLCFAFGTHTPVEVVRMHC